MLRLNADYFFAIVIWAQLLLLFDVCAYNVVSVGISNLVKQVQCHTKFKNAVEAHTKIHPPPQSKNYSMASRSQQVKVFFVVKATTRDIL
jgi:hypothetical protein